MTTNNRPSHVVLTFSNGASARVRLLWAEAPRTIDAILSLCDPATGSFDVSAMHARHSGAEALFLTPTVLRDVGDENCTLPVQRGDVLFGFEPTGICNHATEDASEIAWVYHNAATPRRWVSVNGDPTNHTSPFQTQDIALNLWGKIEGDAEAFYAASGKLPRTGERPMTLCISPPPEVDAHKKRKSAPSNLEEAGQPIKRPAVTAAPTILSSRPLAFTKPRAVLMAVQIPTDTVLDSEGPLLMQNVPGVWLRMQKCEFETEAINAETYLRAADNISRAASALLPQSEVTAVGLACTSFSFVLGPERVGKQLRAACPHAKTTDMASAQAAALSTLGVTRIALVTPYIADIATKNAAMLESTGLRVVSHETMGLTHDSMTDKVSAETIKEWAIGVDCSEAEALVIGCSAMRACAPGFIDDLEATLGKPVVTSTQAFLWSLLRTAGIHDQFGGYGKLFAEH